MKPMKEQITENIRNLECRMNQYRRELKELNFEKRLLSKELTKLKGFNYSSVPLEVAEYLENRRLDLIVEAERLKFKIKYIERQLKRLKKEYNLYQRFYSLCDKNPVD